MRSTAGDATAKTSPLRAPSPAAGTHAFPAGGGRASVGVGPLEPAPRHPLFGDRDVRRSYLLEVAWRAANAGVKAATIAFAVDALFHSDAPRFRGKAIRTRAFGYTAALFAVPVAWRLRFRSHPYPRALDLAVSVPLLLDAAGNGMGMYEHAHVDDVVHFANSAVVAAVAGALAGPQVRTAWEAGTAGALVGISGEAAWEIMEYSAWKMGANGMDLTYDDTMADMIESTLGAILGGVFTWLHHGPGHARPETATAPGPTDGGGRHRGRRTAPLVRGRMGQPHPR